MFLEVTNLVLPLALALALGLMGRRIGWFTGEGMEAFKNAACNIMLPVVLFNAMFTAEYSLSTLVTIAAVFAGLCIAMVLAFLIGRAMPGYGPYMPFMLDSSESGMLGYPLIGVLFGAVGMQRFAIADLPQTAFFFIVMASLLRLRDGLAPDPKALAKSVLSTPPLDGLLLGMVCGLLGLDELLRPLALWSTYEAVVSFITGPTTVLILFYLGYSISFKKELMGKVVVTSLIRLGLMGAMAGAVCLAVFSLVPYDEILMWSILLVFLLPPSYAIPVISKLEGNREYISTTISFSTVLSLLIFVGMTILVVA